MSALIAGLILLADESGKKESPYTQIVFIVGMALAIIVLLRFSRKNRGAAAVRAAIEKAEQPERSDRTRGPGTGHPEGRQDPEVAKLYIELDEFTRELEGRMDTKIAYLRKLLAEAERVIGELDRAIASAAAPVATQPVPVATQPAAAAAAAAAPGEPPAGHPLAEHAPAAVDITIGDPAGGAAGSGGGAKSGQEEAREKILRLAGEGKPKEAIVGEVGLPKGEVELVLSLHRAQVAGSAAGAREERKGGPRADEKNAKAEN